MLTKNVENTKNTGKFKSIGDLSGIKPLKF